MDSGSLWCGTLRLERRSRGMMVRGKIPFLFCWLALAAQFVFPGGETVRFEDHFADRTLRVDYFQTGNAEEMTISLDRLRLEGPWAGNPNALIDDLNFGNYYVKLVEIASNRVINDSGQAKLPY